MRVNAQMCKLDKQKTASSRKTLGAICVAAVCKQDVTGRIKFFLSCVTQRQGVKISENFKKNESEKTFVKVPFVKRRFVQQN